MIPCQVCLIKSFQVLKTTIILFCIASKISVVCNSSSKSNSWISGNQPLPVDWSSKLAFLLHFSLIYSWDSLLNSCILQNLAVNPCTIFQPALQHHSEYRMPLLNRCVSERAKGINLWRIVPWCHGKYLSHSNIPKSDSGHYLIAVCGR